MSKKVKAPTYRDVYEKAFGPIPKGKVIHHCNLNHEDNRPENLIAISRGLHWWLHRIVANLSLDVVWKIGEGLMDYCIKSQKKEKVK